DREANIPPGLAIFFSGAFSGVLGVQSGPMSEADAARALFVPFGPGGDLSLPAEGARVLLLNAHAADEQDILSGCQMDVQHDFRPFARPFARQGLAVQTDINGPGDYDAVLVRTRRQVEENRALLGAALLRLAPSGLFVAAGANDAGGKRLGKELAALGVD